MAKDIPSTAAQPQSGCLLPAMVLLVTVAVLGAAFLLSTQVRGRPSTTFSAPLARFAPDDPVYVSGGGFYIVRLASGEMLALSHDEPLLEHYAKGCVIRYRETLQAAGHTGAFRSDCTGAVYDLRGEPVEGDSPPMRRHAVSVSGSSFKVNTTACTDGPAGRPVPCKPRT